MAKKLIPMAIAYDFDGTLAPGNMQEYDFIPALNMVSKEFWQSVRDLAQKHEMDEILAYMWTMLRQADKADIRVHKSDFKDFGRNIQLFPGVAGLVQADQPVRQGQGCEAGALHHLLRYPRDGGKARLSTRSSRRSTPRASCSITTALPAGPLWQ